MDGDQKADNGPENAPKSDIGVEPPLTIDERTGRPVIESYGNKQVMSPNMIKYCKYLEMGLSETEASILAGMKTPEEITPQGLSRRRNKAKKYLVSSEKNQRLALSQLQRILRGKPIVGKNKDGEIEHTDYPNNSNILTAVQLVFDRADPVIKKSEKTTVNIDISPVDLSNYRKDIDCIDVTPEEPTTD